MLIINKLYIIINKKSILYKIIKSIFYIMGTTNNNNDSIIDIMKERNEQTLSDIENLQNIEKELYASLEKGGNTMTSDEKRNIVNKISEIFQMRTNLYANLSNMVDFYTANQQSVQNTHAQQIVAIKLIEAELDKSRLKLKELEEDKTNKIKQIEINTYYGKSYNAKTYIMKIIVYMCLPILLLAVLHNNGLIPGSIYGFITVIIMAIGFYFIGAQIIDITNRDTMNYDEYNWKFDKSQAPDDSSGSNSANSGENATNPWTTPSITCIGEQCCDVKSRYDSILNKCVPTATLADGSLSNSSKETMANMVFSKYAMSNPLPDTYLANKSVQPYSQKYNKYVSV